MPDKPTDRGKKPTTPRAPVPTYRQALQALMAAELNGAAAKARARQGEAITAVVLRIGTIEISPEELAATEGVSLEWTASARGGVIINAVDSRPKPDQGTDSADQTDQTTFDFPGAGERAARAS